MEKADLTAAEIEIGKYFSTLNEGHMATTENALVKESLEKVGVVQLMVQLLHCRQQRKCTH